MSRAKFASVTASLLARKGEARPWTPLDAETKSYDWQGEIHDLRLQAPVEPMRHVPHESHAEPNGHHVVHGHDGDKRYAIRMSAKEYERLGIIAVKRNVTRQHLMREMFEQYLTSSTSRYCADCTCLDGESCSGG
jgi:hypothetical protein